MSDLTLRTFLARKYAAPSFPVTEQVSERLAAPFAWLFARAGAHPNIVTLLAFASSVGGIAFLWENQPSQAVVFGAFALLQFGYVLDCADGMVARATKRTSFFGGWLDISCDSIIVVALAVIVAQSGSPLGWIATVALAGGKMVYLMTMVMNRQHKSAMNSTRKRRMRWAILPLQIILDTPVFLTLFLAAAWANQLPLLAFAYGASHLAHATLIAARIQGASHANSIG